MEQKKKKLRLVAIILGVVLALSLGGLVGTLISNGFFGGSEATVSVPDNLISLDTSTAPTLPETQPTEAATDEPTGAATAATEDATVVPTERSTTATAPATTKPSNNNGTSQRKAATIDLYKGKADDNTPFKAENLFPGDVVTKYFRIKVSYEDKVTVHYHADIRPGYEKLAEVLKARVVLLSDNGRVLYDGLMRDMPKSLTHKLSSAKRTSDELYYEITAYLDTSVGNEYQQKSLIADFRWWIEETGNLTPPTGSDSHFTLWLTLAVASGATCLIVLIVYRRRKGEEHG